MKNVFDNLGQVFFFKKIVFKGYEKNFYDDFRKGRERKKSILIYIYEVQKI